ncbi:hypothetical protein E5345_11135 [Propionibacterium sp. NM47_B9-13]|jgi:broad specificity phosphatase PhoE|nr:hypothetical protein [Cutibacterium modestum]EFS74287.1 hypothetical protein HMPREF9621_01319 [Cutibacterium modestum HL037PA2]EFS91915.1 hypothetical protein HMPREF9607_01889 [Cutibacterium modestum HL044PA1]EFT16181.1 hypothetical protein HMPREF9622_00743 [Cutibacterium modestum HL037PA3]EGG27705.1 hypothetical protein PA08_0391 [Cutibacterium modestum P08]MCP2375006.1 putative phosphomutase, MSMEG_4193 family protein [Cutibacterium modestum 28N]MCP2377214.1 putative phosphomutase, MSMEG
MVIKETGWACPVHIDADLVECDYGSWSGRSLMGLTNEPGWRADVDNLPEVVFPNGAPTSLLWWHRVLDSTLVATLSETVANLRISITWLGWGL